MQNEIVTQSHLMTPGVEQSFGMLTQAHELVEFTIAAGGQSEMDKSIWRLYEITPAGAAMVLQVQLDKPLTNPQRLSPPGGVAAGAQIELRGLSQGKIPTAAVVTASLVGYDPSCCADAGLIQTGFATFEGELVTLAPGDVDHEIATLHIATQADTLLEIVATVSAASNIPVGVGVTDLTFKLQIDGADIGSGVGFAMTLAGDGFVQRVVHESGSVVYQVSGLAAGPHDITLLGSSAGFSATNATIVRPNGNASIFVQETAN